MASFTVQSALISSTPHPIFPHSDQFYVDSATTLAMIAGNGSKKRGHIAYAGPPYPLGTMRATKVLQNIVFFSQPYEHVITVQIISKLCGWIRNHGGRLTLRLHPRDGRASYSSLLGIFSDVLNLDDGAGVAEIINSHDLCVTRTSSVAKEAIAMGVPVLLCLWSDFDKAVKADYISDLTRGRYHSYSEEDLFAVLSDSEGLIASANELAKLMFEGKTMANLATSLHLRK